MDGGMMGVLLVATCTFTYQDRHRGRQQVVAGQTYIDSGHELARSHADREARTYWQEVVRGPFVGAVLATEGSGAYQQPSRLRAWCATSTGLTEMEVE